MYGDLIGLWIYLPTTGNYLLVTYFSKKKQNMIRVTCGRIKCKYFKKENNKLNIYQAL